MFIILFIFTHFILSLKKNINILQLFCIYISPRICSTLLHVNKYVEYPIQSMVLLCLQVPNLSIPNYFNLYPFFKVIYKIKYLKTRNTYLTIILSVARATRQTVCLFWSTASMLTTSWKYLNILFEITPSLVYLRLHHL